MEAVHTSETSVHFKVTTRRYISEDSKLHTRRRENLKSHLCSLMEFYSDTDRQTFPPQRGSPVVIAFSAQN
jgi:hypothetical protein